MRKLGVAVDPVVPLIDLAKLCGYWWACPGRVAILCERPSEIHIRPLELDAKQGQRSPFAGTLHNEAGPALVYRDGFEVFALDGVRVPPRAVQAPHDLRSCDILTESDVRSRRKLIDRCDLARVVKSYFPGHYEVHRDGFGVLYRQQLLGDEPLTVVLVTDPSTKREYGIRVPPTMKTARQAVAWTFGFEPATYRLAAEA